MIVVADTSPLNYPVLIGAVDILAPLYTRVVGPRTVAAELNSSQIPAGGRAWIAQQPTWVDILPDPPPDETLNALDPGERAAIASAVSLHASRAGSSLAHVSLAGSLGYRPVVDINCRPGPALRRKLSGRCNAGPGLQIFDFYYRLLSLKMV